MNSNQEECMELKNIKYKTMLISGSDIQETKTSNDMNNLEKFLEAEKHTNQAESWAKLDKTIKTQKLVAYAEKYVESHKMCEEDLNALVKYLKECLDKKKLGRVKDVTYDKEKGVVKDIPSLIFNKSSRQYTLKRSEKRVSTLKSLPQKEKKIVIKSVVSKKITTESTTNEVISNKE